MTWERMAEPKEEEMMMLVRVVTPSVILTAARQGSMGASFAPNAGAAEALASAPVDRATTGLSLVATVEAVGE